MQDGPSESSQVCLIRDEYIFICLRQSILNFPTLYAHRVVGLTDPNKPSRFSPRSLMNS